LGYYTRNGVAFLFAPGGPKFFGLARTDKWLVVLVEFFAKKLIGRSV
jgi:hypothetical protein